MSSYRVIRKILFALITALFLCGCSELNPTPSPDQIDKSPFTGIPCEPPCWQGLEVGKSIESEVISILPILSFIQQDTVFIDPVLSMPSIDPSIWTNGVRITASCIYAEKQCLTLKVVDDILTEIEIILNYEIRVDEAIEYLGNPDYVGYQNLGAEKIICDVYLIWSTKKIVLSSSFKGIKEVENNCRVVHDTEKISSILIISKIRYISDASIERLLTFRAGKFYEFSGTLPEQ